jgi:hypothetical protein
MDGFPDLREFSGIYRIQLLNRPVWKSPVLAGMRSPTGSHERWGDSLPSGRPDLNRGPPAPEAGALTGLRYAPFLPRC